MRFNSAEEKAVTGENKAQNDTETVQDFSPVMTTPSLSTGTMKM